jgi:hypothetical protein
MAATQGLKELREAVLEHLRVWPGEGTVVAPGVWETAVSTGGREFAVIYRRAGQRIGVMYLYELPAQQRGLTAAKEHLKRLFGGGTKR